MKTFFKPNYFAWLAKIQPNNNLKDEYEILLELNCMILQKSVNMVMRVSL